MVNVTRKSPFTGKVNTLAINIGQAEFDAAFVRWQDGAMLQDAFHMLDAGDREFIKTGITPQEWADTFGEDN